jgi:tartrate dehydratase alpha subunit/fumarate hydratase class I-like protein
MADTDSTIVDTHSKETGKVSAIASETLSTIVWNRCPPSIGIGVRNPSEYALSRTLLAFIAPAHHLVGQLD